MSTSSDGARTIEVVIFLAALGMAFIGSGVRSVAGAVIVAGMTIGAAIEKAKS